MRLFKYVLLIPVILFLVGLGVLMERANARWDAHAPERAVAALPGVGQGWIDTLRLVAGDAQVEPINGVMTRTEGQYLLGVSEPWHDIISIRTDLAAYAKFIRDAKQWSEGFGYQHPLEVCIPAGVTAHEFGHRWRETLWPHGEVREGGDSLPTWAQGNEEEFADRFARAMLAIRGWDTPDPRDPMLYHIVRMRLVMALAK